MSQALNNRIGSKHRNYGATSNVTPETSLATSSSGNAGACPSEFNSLSKSVGQNITAIINSIRQLEKILKMIGPAKDLSKICANIHTISSETNAQVQLASQDLQRLQAVVLHDDRPQKLQLDKFTSNFEEVVKKYSMLQKQIHLATHQVYQKAVEAEREAETNFATQHLQSQRQEILDLQHEHDMVVERQRQMELIESDILDISAIMNKLSSMVHQQAEVVDSIETTVDQTAANVEEGCTHLKQAAASQNSRRWKILILLVIAVIITIVVIGIIISKVKK